MRMKETKMWIKVFMGHVNKTTDHQPKNKKKTFEGQHMVLNDTCMCTVPALQIKPLNISTMRNNSDWDVSHLE